MNTVDSKTKALDEDGRNTLMALLCVTSNVASKCSAAREYIGLALQLQALDINDNDTSGSSSSGGGGAYYQDGSLEILFSLLTCTTAVPRDTMGMAFCAIANLLQPDERSEVEGRDDVRVAVVNNAGTSSSSSVVGARRAWELLELCQFVPIKLLSQHSSYAAGTGIKLHFHAKAATTAGRRCQHPFCQRIAPIEHLPQLSGLWRDLPVRTSRIKKWTLSQLPKDSSSYFRRWSGLRGVLPIWECNGVYVRDAPHILSMLPISSCPVRWGWRRGYVR